ncbi:MAG: ATP synthase F0 subunit B [Chloroflexi bacterium]|nr:ATP synthase F0 subunit B [Chloroflexota bacterium]
MQAIAETLGLDLRDIIWHTINYMVLLLCLWWIGFRPVMHKLAERERRVRESIDMADRARAEAGRAEEERRAMLTVAHAEAEEIVERAQAEAEQILEAARVVVRNGAVGDAVDARG